eukprot:CAMPEP_0184871166 /NCGR_PEP_ID=MMETSP0580-20130426/40221_1 /TAXON_ID=1118495 /ORGANISM="Dactyliosolen fragilissimus" /LENGTH=80 /DNA_ID=CAMNT_0027373725 /DNA_START=348 /DNA_END=587 /DNA_ORIENTATION=+
MTTDTSFLQRFHPVQKVRTHSSSLNQTWSKCDGSDFGYILFDFLQHQSDAAVDKSVLPLQFLRRYLPNVNAMSNKTPTDV